MSLTKKVITRPLTKVCGLKNNKRTIRTCFKVGIGFEALEDYGIDKVAKLRMEINYKGHISPQ